MNFCALLLVEVTATNSSSEEKLARLEEAIPTIQFIPRRDQTLLRILPSRSDGKKTIRQRTTTCIYRKEDFLIRS